MGSTIRGHAITARRLTGAGAVCIMLINILSLFSAGPAVAASNSGITYHGRILKSDGSPLEGKSVSFKLQIRSPGNESCLLYEEVQTLNMQNSAGVFSLSLNDGTGIRDDNSGIASFDSIFSNRTILNFAAGICATGSSYLPNTGDGRSFVVAFKDEDMASYEALPAQPVNFAPMALQAKQIAGYAPGNLLRFDDTAAAANTTNFNTTQFNNLVGLLNGGYVSSGTAGAGLPVFSAAPASPATGDIWYNSTTGALQYYNGSSTQSLGAGGGTGTVTSVATGTGLTGGPITNAGTISLANFGSAGTYYKVVTDVTGRVSSGSSSLGETDLPSIVTAGKVSGSAITSGTIAGTTAISTSGAITTTGTLTGANVSASTLSGNSLRLFNSGNTFKITFTAPALTADYNLVFPMTAGTNGYVLTTDGSGNLSWAASGGAPSGSAGGDLSGTYPNPSVAKLSGTPLTITSLASGNYIRYNGTAWVNSNLQASDLPSLASGQTGILPIANGGTGTSTGSITGSSSLTFAAGGTNQNVVVTPSGSGFTLLNGKVGVGTSSPSAKLQIAAGTAAAGTSPLKLTAGTNLTTPEAGAIEFDGTSLFYTDSTNTRKTLGVAGAGITALTGDVTASGSGSAAATVVKVDGVSYPAAPNNNTVPVVTSSNTVTYEAVPNAALANSTVTLGSTSVALGGTATSLAGLTSIGLGVNATTAGSLSIANGSASGASITLQNPSATAAYNFNLPATAGTSGYALTSGGGASAPMTWTAIPSASGSSSITTVGTVTSGTWNGSTITVPYGGTGATSLTAHGVLLGEGTSAVSATAAGAAGTVLQGAGSADPTFTAVPVHGVNGTTTGTLGLANGAASGATTTIKPSASTTTAWNLTLPSSGGTSGYVLQTDGTGVTSWVAASSGTGTVNSGTGNQLAYYSSSGTAVSGLTTANSAVLTTNSSGVPAWSLLTNDNFAQYALLAGRSGGQTLEGGTAANNNLTLDSTSSATKGFTLINPSGGSVGIGLSSPTATLQLRAGTATAGTSPLKLTAGTNLTTPEAGAIEFDGTSLFYTDSTNTRRTLGTSGAGITALTGDVTATGSGSVASTVAKVDGVSYPAAPATNTVPVVTASNTVTYEALPNAALANSSITIGSNALSLGSTVSNLTGLNSVGLGVAGSTAGSLTLANTNASGTITVQNPSASAAYNFNLPATAGTSGYALTSGGGASAPMTWTAIPSTSGSSSITTVGTVTSGTWNGSTITVPYGGTGATSLTAHGVLLGEGISAVSATAAGAAGTVLQGAGSADPTFTAAPVYGVNGTTTGTLGLANGSASGATTTIKPSASTTTAWSLTLPSSGGTSGYVLQTDGTGVTSWVVSAPTGTASGDLSGTYPSPTVAKLKGTTVTTTSLATGNFLRYNGSAWVNALLTASDIPSLSSGLTGVLPIANGGTGTSNGSITGSSALTFTAGGSNQNVSLVPSGTGSILLPAKVGINISAPTSPLHIKTDSNGHGVTIDASAAGGDTWNLGDNQGTAAGSFSIQFSSGTNFVTTNGGATGIGGVLAPINVLDVAGGVSIGADYAGYYGAPSNGLFVEGNVGIGANAAAPVAALEVNPVSDTQTNTSTGAVVGGSAGIGTTAGSYAYPFEVQNSVGNVGRLQLATYRRIAGSGWSGSAYRMQFGIDNSFTDGSKAFVEVGSGDYSSSGGGYISLGTNGSDRLTVNNAGQVGIGTTNAAAQLQVKGGVLLLDNAQSISFLNSGAAQASVVGYTSSNNLQLSNPTTAGNIQYLVNNSSGFQAWYTGTGNTERMRLTSSGMLAIGTSSPSAPLTVSTAATSGNIASFVSTGSGGAGCSIAWNGTSCSSDARLKENVVTADPNEMLNSLLKSRPVHFTWIKDPQHDKQTGFIAQELEALFPEFVKTDDNGFKQVNYAHFVSVITASLQAFYQKWTEDSADLHAQVSNLQMQSAKQSDVTALQIENAALKVRLEQQSSRLTEQEKRLEQQAREFEAIKKKLGM